MTAKSIILGSEDFFHARPAARIAAAVSRFESVVMIVLGSTIADARDALSLMRLAHPDGSPVELLADGPDEQEALEAALLIIREEFSSTSA